MDTNQVIIFSLFSFGLISVSFGLKWSDCGPVDAKMRFEKLDLKPLPLIFGSKAVLSTVVKILDTIPNGHSQLEITRVFSVFGMEIPMSLPCIDDYGSCLSDLDFTLRDSDLLCGLLNSTGRICGTPIQKGGLETETYQFDVPELNGIFSLFASVSRYVN